MFGSYRGVPVQRSSRTGGGFSRWGTSVSRSGGWKALNANGNKWHPTSRAIQQSHKLPLRIGRLTAAYRQPHADDVDSDSQEEDDKAENADNINSDSDEDDEAEKEDYEEENECMFDDYNHPRDDAPAPRTLSPTPLRTTASPKDTDEDRPLSPWSDKCTSKQQIIRALKDDTSDIHLFIGDTPTKFEDVNFAQIHQDYAHRYKKSNFRSNIKRILKHYEDKTGSFKSIEAEVEPWKSRGKHNSTGWNLLFELRMNPTSNAKANAMTTEELWKSNTHFKCYKLEDFKKYDKEMVKLTAKLMKKRREENDVFEQHFQSKPHSIINDRGEPFWYNHPAKSLLAEDVKSGLADKMPPKELRESREEYKAFKLETFRKHIYQEEGKQRASPFWRLKRNDAGQKKREQERVEMRVRWMDQRLEEDIDNATSRLSSLNM